MKGKKTAKLATAQREQKKTKAARIHRRVIESNIPNMTHLFLQFRSVRHRVHDGLGELSVEVLDDVLDAAGAAHQRQQALDGLGEGRPVGVQAAEELSEAASAEMCQKQAIINFR